jgi:hypothetical protein
MIETEDVTANQRRELGRMISRLSPSQVSLIFALVMALISKSRGVRVTFEALPF